MKVNRIQDKDTRYFLTIDRYSMKVVGHSFEQKQYLNKGRQTDHDTHRLFITKGQYQKFVERCVQQRINSTATQQSPWFAPVRQALM